MIYSQSGTLYDLLPHATGNLNPPTTQKPRAHTDGLVGAISGVAIKESSGKTSQPSSTASTPNQSTTIPTAEVNSMKFSQKPSGKNKKNKKNTTPSKEQPNTQNKTNQRNVANNDKGKEKPMIFPCKICAEDHLTYKCPLLLECIDFITKNYSGMTLFILHNPFPNPHQ